MVHAIPEQLTARYTRYGAFSGFPLQRYTATWYTLALTHMVRIRQLNLLSPSNIIQILRQQQIHSRSIPAVLAASSNHTDLL
jgi:hypothetical protein